MRTPSASSRAPRRYCWKHWPISNVRLKKLFLNLARLRRGQILRPLRHRIRDKALRSFTRQSVARGVALGIFFGILTPVAQILFAIVGAIVLRANIVVAAATTFISNPLTLPALYFWSYRIGTLLLGHAESSRQLEAVADAAEAAEHALEVASWWSALLGWLASVGPSLALGVVTVACLAAAVAYALVYAIWGLWLRLTGSGPA